MYLMTSTHPHLRPTYLPTYLPQYTTSAVDVTSCFYHVKTFWRHLAWPDPSSAYNLILKIIQVGTIKLT